MVRPADARRSALEALDGLDAALEWLDSDPQASDRWGKLDAVAKRFEIAFEYVWKVLQATAEWQGTEAPGPRLAIVQEAR